MAQESQSDALDRAIAHLALERSIRVGDRTVRITIIVRKKDWRPLRAPWWTGKECSVVAVDTDGNFFLRLSSGSVVFRHHLDATVEPAASSVRAFVDALHADT